MSLERAVRRGPGLPERSNRKREVLPAGTIYSRPLDLESMLQFQRLAGNAAASQAIGVVQRLGVVQRTIDQDARLWAMDWLSTATRPFVAAVRRLGLTRLGSICDGVLGEGYSGAAVPGRVDRSTNSTGLASALVSLGAAKAGQLKARLGEGPGRADALLTELEGHVPEALPQLHLETPQTAARFRALSSEVKDPFVKLQSGNTTFEFSKAMALHMMRRHHPDYIEGAPLQVQSFFLPGTTLKQIEALVTGTVMASSAEIKAWRTARSKKGADLQGLSNLNLRPFFDGKHWELTLELPSTNPTAAAGTVAHFTPTL